MKTLATVVCSVLLISSIGRADVTSTFDSNSEGWQVADLPDSGPFNNVVGNYPVSWNASGGNPGGFISATDPSGNNFFLGAPASFLGNQSSAYGRNLSYDLAYYNSAGIVDWMPPEDVVLVGAGLTLVTSQGAAPTANWTWTHYEIPLLASGWHIGTGAGPAPSEADFKAVLANLTALDIRGEYHYGDDLTGLDNVRLPNGSVPDGGATFGLLGLTVLAMRAVRRGLTR
jgi:hypothetical protein